MTVRETRTFFIALGLLVLPMLGGCSGSDKGQLAADNVIYVNDGELRKNFEKAFEKLSKESPSPTTNKTLIEQLSRTDCVIDNLPAAGKRSLSPQEVYQQGVRSTVIMGVVGHCPKKTCKKRHPFFSSAVIIHEDGIVATNYHVVNTSISKGLGMAIMTHDGRVFLVDEVLAANKHQDVALVKLRNPSGLTAAPLFRDEPVGAPITVISHPNSKFYTLTQGYVSRYAKMGHRSVMNITADYAKGSSGGPFFNSRGDVVGLVSSTNSLVAMKQRLAVGEDQKLLFVDHRHPPKQPQTKASAKKEPAEKVSAPKGPAPKKPAPKKPVKKEAAKKPPHKKRHAVTLETGHQMTIKNGVPSREILNLIKSP